MDVGPREAQDQAGKGPHPYPQIPSQDLAGPVVTPVLV